MKLNIEGVRETVKNDPVAAKVVNAWLSRERDKRVTELRQFRTRFIPDVSFSALTKSVNDLGKQGLLTYQPGKGKVPHKVKWNVPAKRFRAIVATQAKQEIKKNGHAKPAPVKPQAEKLYAVFPIREDYFLKLALPADLTRLEAKRLARFIEELVS